MASKSQPIYVRLDRETLARVDAVVATKPGQTRSSLVVTAVKHWLAWKDADAVESP